MASGHQRVSSVLNAKHMLTLNNINITQKGYVYIWVSNESNQNHNTYFDDLKVTHTKGPVLQEDHYYPFGGSITALSSTAPLSKPNKFKYNSNEEQTDFDWNVYDFNARGYDAALGRFMQIDPMAEIFPELTPYRFGFNNPITFNDPLGLYEGEAGKWSAGDEGFEDVWNYWANRTSSGSSVEDEDQTDPEPLIQFYNQKKHGSLEGLENVEVKASLFWGARVIDDSGLVGIDAKLASLTVAELKILVYIIKDKLVLDASWLDAVSNSFLGKATRIDLPGVWSTASSRGRFGSKS